MLIYRKLKVRSHLDDCADAGGEKNEHRSALVQEIQKDDDLAEGSPQGRPDGESLVRLLPPPERDVVLEREEVEEDVNAADEHRAAQQVQIRVGEDPLDLVDVLLGEAELPQRSHRVLNVQDQPQLADAGRRIRELQRQFGGAVRHLDQIADPRLQEIVLNDRQDLVVVVYSDQVAHLGRDIFRRNGNVVGQDGDVDFRFPMRHWLQL